MKKRILSILLAVCMVLMLAPNMAFAEGELGEYTASGYIGEYDGQLHSITLNFDAQPFTLMYRTNGEGEWQEEKPTFTNAGSYTVEVLISKGGDELVGTCSAIVTITKGTPELYFTPGNIVFQPGEKSRQLKWVYNGDGKLHFTSSDPRHFWVDPSGGLVSLNQEGGVSIWATAPETKNWKSVTAMCIVETESTLPQIDIDTKLDIDYQSGETEYLVEKVQVNGWDGNPVLYIDAKLLDPRDPEQKKELHNVRASFTVPYKEILKESTEPATVYAAYDFAVLHQRSDNIIEEVPFIPRANGLRICDTTCSPFAIVCFPKENYNLYYDVNGGTGTPLNQSVPIDSESYSVTLSSEKPSRAGYKFEGWSTSSDGSVQYMPGDTITLDRDIILYAIWSEETYTVMLNTNGGTINNGNITGYTYGQGAVLPTDVTKAGYTFKGWYDNENLTGSPVTAIGDTDTDNKEYWAKWEANTYTVNFNTDGGNTINDKNVIWTDKVLDGITAPTKNDWEFTGWKCGNTSVTENTTYGDLAVNDTTASITLVAQWKYITAPTGESDYKPTTPTQPTKPTEPTKPTNPTDNKPQIKGDDGKTDNVSTDEQNPSTGVTMVFGAALISGAAMMISRKKKK